MNTKLKKKNVGKLLEYQNDFWMIKSYKIQQSSIEVKNTLSVKKNTAAQNNLFFKDDFLSTKNARPWMPVLAAKSSIVSMSPILMNIAKK